MPLEADIAEVLTDAARAEIGNSAAPVLRLDAWEGPLDLLLELARAQRIDLARISVAELARQFVAVLDAAITRASMQTSGG